MRSRNRMVFWVIASLGIVYFLNGLPASAFAQEKYPMKPITLFIGYPAPQ